MTLTIPLFAIYVVTATAWNLKSQNEVNLKSKLLCKTVCNSKDIHAKSFIYSRVDEEEKSQNCVEAAIAIVCTKWVN